MITKGQQLGAAIKDENLKVLYEEEKREGHINSNWQFINEVDRIFNTKWNLDNSLSVNPRYFDIELRIEDISSFHV